MGNTLLEQIEQITAQLREQEAQKPEAKPSKTWIYRRLQGCAFSGPDVPAPVPTPTANPEPEPLLGDAEWLAPLLGLSGGRAVMDELRLRRIPEAVVFRRGRKIDFRRHLVRQWLTVGLPEAAATPAPLQLVEGGAGRG